MNRHLIVSATSFEIQPVLKRLEMAGMFDGVQGPCFRKGPQEIDVLVSGVGQMQTAFHLAQALTKENYSSVLNFGIAGSFRDSFPKCSLVHIVQEELADLGVENASQLLDLFEIKLMDPNTAPFEAGVLRAPILDLKALQSLPKTKSVTVNRVLSSDSSISAVVTKYDPDVVNMEGAAVFYACANFRIPCAQVRSISDKVGPRDKSTWDIPGAIKILNEKANEMLDELQK